MSSGLKASANRGKTAKHLRGKTKKRFRNEDPVAKAKYQAKRAAMAARKLKKNARRK